MLFRSPLAARTHAQHDTCTAPARDTSASSRSAVESVALVDADVGECTVDAEGAVMGGAAVPPGEHVSSLNCVVVVRGGEICHLRRARPVPPHAPPPDPRAHTNRVIGHVTVSGAKTSAYSAAAALGGVEAMV